MQTISEDTAKGLARNGHLITKHIGTFSRWGRPQIDLFATRLTELPLFVSPVPDPLAVNVDALTLDWTGPDAYAFPPPALMGLVLKERIGTLSSNSTSSQLAGSPVVSVMAVSTYRDSSKTTGETGSSHSAPTAVGASEVGSLQATRLETFQLALCKGFSDRVSSSIARARKISTERISITLALLGGLGRATACGSLRSISTTTLRIPDVLTQENKFSRGTVKSYRSAICTTTRQKGRISRSIPFCGN
jgi:hypothetical protein